MISLTLPEDPFNDLDGVCQRLRESYRTAEPFPHCCIDNLVSEELLQRVVEEFPSADSGNWELREREAKSKGKSITSKQQQLGPYTKYLMGALGSARFLRFVEELTGIRGVISDPYMHGGGLHEIRSGGFLELHADFNWQARLHMYRRLNLLLYLNKDWKEEYNGALEVWDRKLTSGRKYYPLWNRMVIQHVTSDAMHGFPEPIRCPESMTRKSLALWYYTAELPAGVQVGYDLSEPNFVRRAGQPRPLPRPLWRRLAPPALAAFIKRHSQTKSFSGQQFVSVATRFVPPLVIEAYQRLRGRVV